MGFHVQALIRLGTTKAELEDASAMAIYMGGLIGDGFGKCLGHIRGIFTTSLSMLRWRHRIQTRLR